MGQRNKIKPQSTIGSFFGIQDKSKAEEPKKTEPKTTAKKSTQQGLSEGLTRTSIVVRESLLESMRTIAFLQKDNVSNHVNNAMEDYINNYEKKHGKLPVLR